MGGSVPLSLPSAATRVLLLTDLVESASAASRPGGATTAGLSAAHDRTARDLLVAHRGREIDRTDGFLLLFDDVDAAVSYALAYHASLRPLGLRARAGLHAGPAVLRENSAEDVARGAKPVEVEGLAKPTAARVMSVATAGQTLMTAAAAASWSSRTAPSAVVVSHGHWELRGVAEPVELFEVGVPGACPLTPPPDADKVWRVVRRADAWVRARDIPHSLPRERDEFFGREEDLRGLAQRLEGGASLVSVIGGSGIGKSRLVTRCGWNRLGAWPGGVWFCDLSTARDAEGICRAVARGVDVPLGGDDAVARLGRAIAGRRTTLVVLDGLDHAAPHAAGTLGRWLELAPEARVVVTAREAVGLSGESALRLAPLPTDPAVALFMARAAAARRDFVLAETDRPVVAELVRVLGGMPRAIERAATRVRMMPPKTILERARSG